MEHGVRVAHISFAYHNRRMIKILLKRGKHIIKGHFTHLKAIHDDIRKLVEEHRDKLSQPCGAYITFET